MIQKQNWTIQKINILPTTLAMPECTSIGIDPGTTNLGIAVLHPSIPIIELFQVKITRDKDAVIRIQNMYKILSNCINFYRPKAQVYIEGASYGDRYRQVELAEIRTTAIFWSFDHSFISHIVSPSSIRKSIFGSAKIKAHDYWTNIPHDCAAALSCALLATLSS